MTQWQVTPERVENEKHLEVKALAAGEPRGMDGGQEKGSPESQDARAGDTGFSRWAAFCPLWLLPGWRKTRVEMAG